MLERTAGRSRDVGAVGEMRSPCWSHQLEFGGRTTPLKDVMGVLESLMCAYLNICHVFEGMIYFCPVSMSFNFMKKIVCLCLVIF